MSNNNSNSNSGSSEKPNNNTNSNKEKIRQHLDLAMRFVHQNQKPVTKPPVIIK